MKPDKFDLNISAAGSWSTLTLTMLVKPPLTKHAVDFVETQVYKMYLKKKSQ